MLCLQRQTARPVRKNSVGKASLRNRRRKSWDENKKLNKKVSQKAAVPPGGLKSKSGSEAWSRCSGWSMSLCNYCVLVVFTQTTPSSAFVDLPRFGRFEISFASQRSARFNVRKKKKVSQKGCGNKCVKKKRFGQLVEKSAPKN